MDFRRGYCEWNCNECGKVCPTQAIRKLELPKKQQTVIGRAYIDRNICIPWSEGRDCLVCEELCPVPKKAVIFAAGSAIAQGGRTDPGVVTPGDAGSPAAPLGRRPRMVHGGRRWVHRAAVRTRR